MYIIINSLKLLFHHQVQYEVSDTDTSHMLFTDGGYFVHYFSLSEGQSVLPKHVIFVLDVSRFMQARKIQQVGSTKLKRTVVNLS